MKLNLHLAQTELKSTEKQQVNKHWVDNFCREFPTLVKLNASINKAIKNMWVLNVLEALDRFINLSIINWSAVLMIALFRFYLEVAK